MATRFSGVPLITTLIIGVVIRWCLGCCLDFCGPTKNVRLMSCRCSNTHKISINLRQIRNELSEILFSLVPVIVLFALRSETNKAIPTSSRPLLKILLTLIVKIIVGIEQSLPFPGELSVTILFELGFHLLSFLLDDVYRITAFAIAKLAAIWR